MQQYQNGPYGDTRIQQNNNMNDQSPYRNIAQQAQMAQQYNQQQIFQSPPPPQNQQMQNQTVSSMKYMQTPIQVYNNQVRTLQTAHTVIPHVHQYKVPHQQQQQQQLISGREISQVRQTLETKQPEIHELYHVERELQVLSVEEVEIPWKRKCVELEIQIYDLQTELARYKNMAMGEKLTVSDDSQIQQYELRLRQQRDIEAELRAEINEQNNEIEQWRSRYQRLQQEFQSKSQSDDEIRQLRDTIVDRDRRILKLEEQLKQNDLDYQNLMRDTQALDQENMNLRNELTSMDERMTTVTQTERMVVSLEGEVELWKERFKKSNTEYHKLQNQLTDAQAELDALKNKRTVVTTEKVTTNQTNVQHNIRNSRYQPNSSATTLMNIYNKLLTLLIMKQIIRPTPIEPFNDPSQRVQTYNAFSKDKYPNYYFQNESYHSQSKGQYYIGKNQLPQTMSVRKGAKPFKMSKAFKISEFWSEKQHNIILKKTGLKSVGRFIQNNQEEQRKQFVQGLQLELQANLDNLSIDDAFNGGIQTQRDMPTRPFRFNSQISVGTKLTEITLDTHRTRVCSHTTLEQLRNKFKKLHDIGRQAMVVRPRGIITRI